MACNEFGLGRMAEPAEILAAIEALIAADGALSGRRAIVTSGPTHEPIDPVRFIGNRSSGKQGHAIAAALARRGADTYLIAGPTGEPDPPGVHVRHVETARADAGCLPRIPARRHRRLRRRRRRLEGGGAGRAEDQERQRAAEARAGAQSGHPGDAVAGGQRAAGAGDRLCRGNRTRRRAARRKSCRPSAATGSSPTTCRRAPARSAATTTWCI